MSMALVTKAASRVYPSSKRHVCGISHDSSTAVASVMMAASSMVPALHWHQSWWQHPCGISHYLLLVSDQQDIVPSEYAAEFIPAHTPFCLHITASKGISAHTAFSIQYCSPMPAVRSCSNGVGSKTIWHYDAVFLLHINPFLTALSLP